MTINKLSESKSFSGTQSVYSHLSTANQCNMRFGLYLPANIMGEIPALFWLSGLTSTEENFMTKSGIQRLAAAHQIAIIMPDTSPRGENVPDDESNYLGTGASFYLDATEPPWKTNYRMFTYLSDELPQLIFTNFPIDKNRIGIFGHSMGGHGAIMLGLRCPSLFKTISAFSPLSSLLQSPWGQQAIKTYLGTGSDAALQYDVVSLMLKNGWKGPPILIDQGTADPFINEQLQPGLLTKAASKAQVPLLYREQVGYDHSYYFIATFLADHIKHHEQYL